MDDNKRFAKKDVRGRSMTIATASPQVEKSINVVIKKNTERMISKVPPPEGKKLEEFRLFKSGDKPDLEVLQDHLYREGRLDLKAAAALIQRAKEVFKKEPNLLRLQAPVSVCGDIHGQFYDLVNILKAGGPPASTTYLFLGDYVDRGCFSTDVCFLLFAHKICYPKSFFMLRGNHECRLMTSYFNFKLECTKKYSLEIYDLFMECFDCLPLAASIETGIGTFLCMHGGLSPEIDNLEDIEIIDRFMEPPKTGPLCDLIWSDPIEEGTAEGLTEEELDEWFDVQFVENPTRGCGYIFGYAAAIQFCEDNNLISIIRAHEVQAEGYFLHYFLRDDREHPPCITIFSAPNYCDMYNNQAAVMKIDKDGYQFHQVAASEHPFYLPDMMDGLNWSFPFVLENLTDLSLAILKICQECRKPDPSEGAEKPVEVVAPPPKQPSEFFNNRLKTVGGMLVMLKTLREERDQLLKLKQFAEDCNDAVEKFKKAQKFDKDNEVRPGMTFQRRRTKTI
eukprot:TRINITY_DN100_c0_g1_i1.p1 TRINITY_DN100_c0_g1~~TRINITY_DN100_c0_g1_i1.p1  ORF type:complete len:536 (-),score=144.12 TRINITY_DN100_c0_g1_i1:121-1641(-)